MMAALAPIMAPTTPTPPPAAPPAAPARTAEPAAAATNPSGSVPDFTSPPAAAPAAEETPSTSSQWKAYKETQAAKYEALQKEFETFKKTKTSEVPQDYETIKKQNEDLSKRLAAHAIEKHPKFQEYFDGRIKQQVETVSRLGDVGKKIASIITQPESEYRNATLNDLISSLSPLEQSKVGAVMVQLDNIQAERQSEIAKADQTYAKMNQDNAQSFEQRKAQIDRVTSAELDRARKAIPLLQTREGDEVWNSGVKAIEGQVHHLLHGKLSESEMARAAIWSATAPQLVQELNAKVSRVTELEAQIARLQAASPDPSRPSGSPAAPAENPNEDFGTRVARLSFGRA